MNTNAKEPAKTRRRIVKERVDQVRRGPNSLPDLIKRKQEEQALRDNERLDLLARRFEQTAEKALADKHANAAVGPVSPQTERSERDASRSTNARKEHLEPAQHMQLRRTVERLWKADERLQTWTLLAKAAGLASGQAVKRAYEVNSSVSTLRNLETFAQLYTKFGGQATSALKTGVAIEDLHEHLITTAAEVEVQSVPPEQTKPKQPLSARERRGLTSDHSADGAPVVDFAALLEAGEAIDREIDRLGRVAEFFKGLSQEDSLPALVRGSAAAARKHVLDAVESLHVRRGTTPA